MLLPQNPQYVPLTLSEVLLIQCKNLKVEKSLSKTEINNLLELAKQTGGKPLHVFNRDHKLVIQEIGIKPGIGEPRRTIQRKNTKSIQNKTKKQK